MNDLLKVPLRLWEQAGKMFMNGLYSKETTYKSGEPDAPIWDAGRNGIQLGTDGAAPVMVPNLTVAVICWTNRRNAI